ncbi:MAG: efflux RND transporter permease subunit, partial [bacterium]|nr:efflux RND transporter permease subunit [bacterium]
MEPNYDMIFYHRLVIYLGFCLLFILPSAFAADPAPLTLEQCISLAAAKNSDLKIQQEQLFQSQQREKGLGVVEALLYACPLRLRPIMMTAITTIVAAIPAALAIGPGSESRIPMAIVGIGG